MIDLIANWPAPANIGALTTTKRPGLSQGPYASHNLALHVGDDPNAVLANRKALRDRLSLPGEPAWLEQTHSTRCVVVEDNDLRVADAAITRNKQIPLVILTGDCLPILLCNRAGTEIAAIHAGWRGLLNGIILNTVSAMQSQADTLLAWIGPAICQRCYPTGSEVETDFVRAYPTTAHAFLHKAGQIHADLEAIASDLLTQAGVGLVTCSSVCTYESENSYYSYRRSAQTGRMATLIWFK
jgi:YfiH family protein